MILLHAENGAWRLPAFSTVDHHTGDVDFINSAVRKMCGLDVTVLRCLRHEADTNAGTVDRIFELESHGELVADGTWEWYAPDQLAVVRWTRPADAATVQEWLADGIAFVDGDREWTQPGWWDQAKEWIADTLRAQGAGPIRAGQQVRVWEFSCVFRIETDSEVFYFKALPTRLAREQAVTEYLSRRIGGCAPQVVANDSRRRWLLMRAAGGVNLEMTTDLAAWQRGVAGYARLQVDSLAHLDALRACGCETLSLEKLAAHMDGLLADTPAFLAGEPEGLSAEEIARLRNLRPELLRRCAAVSSGPIAVTLDHGDLWPANVLVDDTRCTVIDWEDARIAHPFLSLAPLLAGAHAFHPSLDPLQLGRDLAGPYLEPFETIAPAAAMRELFTQARPLGTLDLAVRYWQQPPSVVRMHPWMRENVPWLLRIMMKELDE